MDKQQIVSFIREALTSGNISKSDILGLVNERKQESQVSQPLARTPEDHSKNLIRVFYAIGAIIAVIGVIILVVQNWNDIGFAGRIFSTLGISLLTYVAGLIFTKPEQNILSQVMFSISAALAPLGSFVLLKEASIDFTYIVQIAVALVLFILFGVASFISKKSILNLFVVGFITWAYYVFVIKIFGFGYSSNNLLEWAIIIQGLSYILIAYSYESLLGANELSPNKEKKAIQNIFYMLGTLAILGAGISIGGVFDLIFIAFIFAGFYGSVYLKSRAMLNLSAVFLVAHIIKITSKYFADSISWPVALIVVGFLVIGIGYGTFYLNRRIGK